jgi:hypothetical protein
VSLPPLPANNLLIADRPLLVLPRLVAFVGLNEAIVLQQVRYWLSDDLRPQVRDGRRWVYNSYEDWQERNFPFWSVATVKRAFASLERQGLLISANYNKSGRDHTKWYTVDFDRLLELDRLYRAAHGQAVKRREQGPRGARAAELPPLPATDLLLDEEPLLLLPRLATRIGFDEALVLQQVRYWLGDRRAPLVRDGRRWVRCPLHRWHEQFPFRSAPTINRVIRELTESGLLIATAAHNQEGGDRTLWYTIDFERVAALDGVRLSSDDGPEAAPEQGEGSPEVAVDALAPPLDHSAPIQLIKMSRLGEEVPAPSDHSAPPDRINLTKPWDQDDPAQAIDLNPTLKGTETWSEIQTETLQQHDRVGQQALAPVVVATSNDLVERLTARGITRSTAAQLVAHHAAAQIDRQVQIFDFLRDETPADPRLTPGRLRRQIEEDWASPPGFIAMAERAQQTEADRVQAHERELANCASSEQTVAAGAARQALLDAIGLAGADQALWARVTQLAPPLPSPFRDALFHAPQATGDEAAVIFREHAAWARATGLAQTSTRARIESRVAELSHRPGVRVHYLLYDDVLRLLSDNEGNTGTVSDSAAD